MRLEEITPNIAIHCKTCKQAKILQKSLGNPKIPGDFWRDSMSKRWNEYKGFTCFIFPNGFSEFDFFHYEGAYYVNGCSEIIEFDDLEFDEPIPPDIKLREFGSDTAIQCIAKEEFNMFADYLDCIGICYTDVLLETPKYFPDDNCYVIDFKYSDWLSFSEEKCRAKGYNIVRFKDLVIRWE